MDLVLFREDGLQSGLDAFLFGAELGDRVVAGVALVLQAQDVGLKSFDALLNALDLKESERTRWWWWRRRKRKKVIYALRCMANLGITGSLLRLELLLVGLRHWHRRLFHALSLRTGLTLTGILIVRVSQRE